MKKEAMFYEKLGGGSVRCSLCSHNCLMQDKEWGYCGVRKNEQGRLFTSVYGEIIESNVHFLDGSYFYRPLAGTAAYTVATVGCNFSCGFCRNWKVSQIKKKELTEKLGHEQTPAQVALNAVNNGCRSIIYNYTEPTVFFEYAFDIARAAMESGLKNVFCTNGYLGGEALETLSPFIDAFSVDMKSCDDEFYKSVCDARLKPVVDTVKRLYELGKPFEISTLIIPGKNDSEPQLRAQASFIASVDPDIPWRLTRFNPHYKYIYHRAEPAVSMERAAEIGRSAGLNKVEAEGLPFKVSLEEEFARTIFQRQAVVRQPAV